jgi:mannose-1-phosphate guanylyltransferase
MDAGGRVLEFREKPAELVPGDINAGTYVLEPVALDGWTRGENVSIERQIFPALIADGRPLAGFVSEAYWMDLGTPQAYLQAQFDLLDGRVDGHRSYPSPFVDAGGRIDAGATVNAHVVVGPNATIDAGARVRDSVLHERAGVEPEAVVERSILGTGSTVMRGASVSDSVLGEGAVVGAGASVHEGRVQPGERVEA